MNARVTNVLAIAGIVLLTIGVTWGMEHWNDRNEEGDEERMQVQLYYYNAEEDKRRTGMISCSSEAILAVNRSIAATKQPLRDTLELLLSGTLTPEEKAWGFETELPHPTLRLMKEVQENGNLTLTFDDPDHFTTGGSCRVGILRSQIEKTVRQFPGVERVIILPEELFQP